MGNQGQQGVPFQEGSLEVSRTEIIIEKGPFPLRMSQGFTKGFGGTVPIFRGQPPSEIASAGDVPVASPANRAETAAFARQGLKTMAGPQVGQVMNQFIDWVGFVLQGRRHRQPLPLVEETEDDASARGIALPINQAQLKPSLREGIVRARSFIR